MPTALVTGATGILGREIVHELGKDPSTWTQVHALSRSKKEDYPKNVTHQHVDLTASADELKKQLSGVSAEYVFFAAYLQGDSEQEMYDTNGAMLRNFLRAVQGIRRVVLVTGAKQYGVHLGPAKIPMEESDPWLQGQGYPPNFYYAQQDILKEEGSKSGFEWVVTYPNDVIGVAKGNFMNLSSTLGIYCAVTKELGQDLNFPGSEEFYSYLDCFSSAPLHARFCVWAATAKTTANQAFNVHNGDTESWQNLWPKVAKHFGLKVPNRQFAGPAPGRSTLELSDKPPITELASQIGIQDRVPKGRVEQRIDLVKWSQREEVKAAWDRLAEREGLDKEAFTQATWGFLGFVLGRTYNLVISMSKARAAGWNGYVDTWESLRDSFDGLVKEKVLPKFE